MKNKGKSIVSISHLVILGIFIVLGSVGLAMMQSALSVVWSASGLARARNTAATQIAKPRMISARIGSNRSV